MSKKIPETDKEVLFAYSQWQIYKSLCTNRDNFEFSIGKRLKKNTLYELLKSKVISEDLPNHEFQLLYLNGSWVPIDSFIAYFIKRINEKGYITSASCSGHEEYYDLVYNAPNYNQNYYIEFAEIQTTKNLEAAFEFLFYEITGREMTDEESENSGWLIPEIETHIVLLMDRNTNIYKGKVGENIIYYHIEVPKNLKIPEQIKSITLCRHGNKFTLRARVLDYYLVHYINEFLFKYLL